MEYPRLSLVVLTLLQLCPAEQFAPQWYSASDGFQPKPISELFTTEPSFSSEKPIVVNQFSSVPDDPVYSSSPLPITRSETTLSQTYPTVAMPAGALYKVHLTQIDPLKTIDEGQQKYGSIVPFIQTIPNTQPGFELKQVAVASFRPEDVQPLEPKQTYTSGLPLTSLFEPQKTTYTQPQMQTTVYQPPQTQSPIYSSPPTTYSTTPPTTFTTTPSSTTPPTTLFSTTPSTPLSTTPFTTYSTPPPTFRSTPPTTFSTASSYPTNPSSPTFRTPNSNYILIYQQAPQSYQTFPPSPEVTIRQSTPSTVNFPRTEFSTTISTTSPMPPFSSTKPMNKTSTMSTSSVKVTSSSNYGISNQRDCVKYSLCRISTTVPLPSGLNKKGTGIGFPLKIRVVAPLGSITNVNINPATTTKRPVTKKTKRPTTRRTSKPKKNNYDRCLDGCRKVRDPICAAPLSHVTIDPKTLRGFPSVCHMACHNSYRNEPFEKVIDGSCSKLRTRIRLIDSKSKLRRDELQKNEYSVDTDPDTVIEVLSNVN